MTSEQSGPVRLTVDSRVRFRPALSATITAGLWAERRRINREVSVPQAWDRLHEAGNFHNLELAAGQATGAYVNDLPFLDSDVHKWLEAVGWTLADPELDDSGRARLEAFLDVAAELLATAQEDDGYLDSHFQVRFPGERFVQLAWGHELYCAGHLLQAAVALHRTTADARLLRHRRPVRRPGRPILRRRGGPARRRLRSSRDRVGAGRAVPRDRRGVVPANRPGTSSTGGVTDCWVTTGSGGTTGRTTPRSARRSRSRATPYASSTCWPASPTSTPRPATKSCGWPRNGSGTRWSRPRPI